uniref:Uncharacterized protein n=1 Tax=Timema poppense TaxID=170557 RepID=A0A7R9D217_TIMPO|nr:unnamed protein product [Timema poppensis]
MLQLRLLSSSIVLRSGFRSVSTTISRLDKPVTVKQPVDVGANSSANLGFVVREGLQVNVVIMDRGKDVAVMQGYAPQGGCPVEEKDKFEEYLERHMKNGLQVVMGNLPQKHAMLDQALNKARVKMCLYMMAATLLGCLVYVYSGKQAAKRGETLAKITIDHHNLLREEAKKQREEAIQQQAIK